MVNETVISARPSRRDPEIIREAARRLCEEQVFGYLDERGEHIVEQVAAVMRYSTDGYEMCKELDRRHGWDCDRELVDIMDGADWNVDAVYRGREAEWVKANGIEPRFKIGDHVKTPNALFPPTDKTHEGIVYEIDTVRGYYTVRVPSLGHVESGVGTLGSIWPYERITDLWPAESHTGPDSRSPM